LCAALRLGSAGNLGGMNPNPLPRRKKL
jgi:hypothetical protein